MDSSDFPLQRGKGRGRKSSFWSFKLNHPGRRYTFLLNGSSEVVRLWGGYSPKVYDGTFIATQKEWMEENLAGAGVFADQHYASASRDLSHVTFYCPYKKTQHATEREEEEQRISEDEDDDGVPMALDDANEAVDLQVLTKQQGAWNKAQCRMWAKVEYPFGLIKLKWKSLRTPWAEDTHDLDCVVWTACAVYNMS